VKYKYFTESEFDSPDAPGSGVNVDPNLIYILDLMREECGFVFHVNSGFRTMTHNQDVHGETDSDHLMELDGFSHAADIRISDSRQRFLIIKSALSHGIKRLGVGKDFVHISNNQVNPQQVLWLY